jgi:p-cumate 2,3-dioxygenase subunit beta
MSTAELNQALPVRLEVEDFLFHEADLLDRWQLDDWAELFTEDAQYTVPATDLIKGDPRTDLVLLDDNIVRIRARVTRLNSRRAHREFPWSRTRRIISNVRILADRNDELDVAANFAVYRIRHGMNVYVGQYLYTLVRHNGSFMIKKKRAEMDLETLDPHGTVSIIL